LKVAEVRELPPPSAVFQWFSKVEDAIGPAASAAGRANRARNRAFMAENKAGAL
jgi:hypothetical protein